MRAGTVAAYWPMRGEPDARWLLEALEYHQFTVALPVVEAPARPLGFRRWSPRVTMLPGPLGATEPSRRSPMAWPDVLFVPMVAFDRRGHRLGYGGGYYDATLRALRVAGGIVAVGVAFATQEVARIPDEATDEVLDFALTEREFIDFGGPSLDSGA